MCGQLQIRHVGGREEQEQRGHQYFHVNEPLFYGRVFETSKVIKFS